MTPERWAQIKQAMQAALDLPEPDRRAYLDSACGNDPALRDEVESLLAAHNQASGFLDVAASPPKPPDPGYLAAGTRLGPYVLVQSIGEGGMGTVYQALREDIGQLVALKVVQGGIESQFLLSRFANERRILWHRRLLLFLRRLRWRGTHASRLRKRHLDGPDSGMQFHHVHRGGRHDDDTNLCGWKDLRAHHQRRWRLHGPASVRGQRLRQGPHLSTVPPKPVGQLFCELFPLGRGNRLLATLLLRPRPRRLRLDDDWPVRSQSATSKAAPWAWARSIVLLLRHRPPASL